MTRMNKSDVMGMLQEHGALVSGHFELLSGLHSPTFVRTAVVLQYPHIAQKLARALCAKFPQDVDVVVSPGMGGAILGQEVAKAKKCRSIFTERGDGGLELKPDFRLEQGERVLIVVDAITTGRATGELVALVSAYGARVVGVAALVDRSVSDVTLKVPVRSLVSYPVRVSSPQSCPMCAQGMPLTKTQASSSRPAGLGRAEAEF